MPTLSDKLVPLDFEGLDADAAWAACQEWEDWVYSHLSDEDDFLWVDALCINDDNYSRYYEVYENEQDADCGDYNDGNNRDDD